MNMCKAWEDGMAKAQQLASEEGRKEGRKETLVEFIKDGIISVADGAKRLGVSQEKMLTYINE